MFRAFRLRAILFPLGVAIASITAVAWYGLIKIPAQQRYVTDRNLRLLKTKAAQIKSKVDNYDTSIDNALDFYPQGEARRADLRPRRLGPTPLGLDRIGVDLAYSPGDSLPQYERVHFDALWEHLNWRLGYKHNGKIIVARTDIEKAVAPFLSAGSEFDAVLLVTRDGSVIAQQSASGLELAHVDGLRRSTAAAAGSADPKGAAAPTLFEQMRKSTNVENVILGNAEYQLYVQPLQLSLATAEGDMKGQEEWALCGLVRGDHFRAAGSAISYTYLLWFGAALATVCLAIPLLKLHILSPNERFRGADGVFVAMTTFAAAGLITFCAIDAYYFHVEVTGRARAALAEVADDIGTRFRGETTAIAAQMNALRQLDFWKDNLNYTAAEVPPQLHLGEVEAGALPTTIRFDGHYLCVPEWACRDNILVNNRKDFEQSLSSTT